MDFVSTCGANNAMQGVMGIHPNVNYHYNPFELTLAGNINSETNKKTINHLINELSRSRTVGVVNLGESRRHEKKASAGRPDLAETNATSILVIGKSNYRLSGTRTINKYEGYRAMIDTDIVLILTEHSMPNSAKIIFQDDGLKPAKINLHKTEENIIAACGNGPSVSKVPNSTIAYLANDDIAGLRDAIDDYFRNQIDRTLLSGLVLTGGKSTRMKRDKAALQYHGKTQSEYCYDLLSKFCEKVYLSNRKEQRSDAGQKNLPQIHDIFNDVGPLGGILTALHARPSTPWLVLACDLPFVDFKTLEELIRRRNPYKMATAYVSTHDGFPEPLCAIYEPKSIHRFMQFFALGYKCPRKVLINSDVQLLRQSNKRALINVNNTNEYQRAIAACRTLEESTPKRGYSSKFLGKR